MLSKKSIQSANIRIRKMDQEYLGMNKLLLEYKNKISDMDITSHIFNVVRIGSIVDSPADVRRNNLSLAYVQ